MTSALAAKTKGPKTTQRCSKKRSTKLKKALQGLRKHIAVQKKRRLRLATLQANIKKLKKTISATRLKLTKARNKKKKAGHLVKLLTKKKRLKGLRLQAKMIGGSILSSRKAALRTSEWVCQDKCLDKKNGQICGQTDHL